MAPWISAAYVMKRSSAGVGQRDQCDCAPNACSTSHNGFVYGPMFAASPHENMKRYTIRTVERIRTLRHVSDVAETY